MACLTFPVGVATAKCTSELDYTLEQTYHAALRLVRVDLGLKVTERDPSAAYVLFDYRSSESGSRVVPGSIEMVVSGRSVHLVVQLPQMPRYHEQVLVDSLKKKLRDEYGEPTTPRPALPRPDAGVDEPDASP